MADPTFQVVEKGSNFETYQGQLCGLRLDWRPDAMRAIYTGLPSGDCADAIIRHWDDARRLKQRITMLHDLWEVDGYDSELRVKCTDYGKKYPDTFAAGHFLTKSKITNMALAVVTLALPNLNIQGHGKRAEFDLMAKKFGLPLNPPVPLPRG